MRTTLNVPEDLMEEALRITRFRSKTDVVIYSLKELIRRKRLEELKDLKGKVDIEIDLKRSRRRTG
jgi:Arc/MetJ family transcription regulator